ncbi:glycerol-3-phosphate cytidylyltransferase [Virgibacillus ainsalahensis]
MKRIITYGTFDLLHPGHIKLLSRAKEMGDYLIVGVSTDAFNRMKKKQAYYSYEDRKIIVEAIRFVDKVIPEHTWEQKIDDINEQHADIFVMGDDWQGKFDYLTDYCDVVYLPRTTGVSSTKIKKHISTMKY